MCTNLGINQCSNLQRQSWNPKKKDSLVSHNFIQNFNLIFADEPATATTEILREIKAEPDSEPDSLESQVNAKRRLRRSNRKKTKVTSANDNISMEEDFQHHSALGDDIFDVSFLCFDNFFYTNITAPQSFYPAAFNVLFLIQSEWHALEFICASLVKHFIYWRLSVIMITNTHIDTILITWIKWREKNIWILKCM